MLQPIRAITDHIYRNGALSASYKAGDLVTVTDSLNPDKSYVATYRYKADKSGAIIEFSNGNRTRVPFCRLNPYTPC